MERRGPSVAEAEFRTFGGKLADVTFQVEALKVMELHVTSKLSQGRAPGKSSTRVYHSWFGQPRNFHDFLHYRVFFRYEDRRPLWVNETGFVCQQVPGRLHRLCRRVWLRVKNSGRIEPQFRDSVERLASEATLARQPVEA